MLLRMAELPLQTLASSRRRRPAVTATARELGFQQHTQCIHYTPGLTTKQLVLALPAAGRHFAGRPPGRRTRPHVSPFCLQRPVRD